MQVLLVEAVNGGPQFLRKNATRLPLPTSVLQRIGVSVRSGVGFVWADVQALLDGVSQRVRVVDSNKTSAL